MSYRGFWNSIHVNVAVGEQSGFPAAVTPANVVTVPAVDTSRRDRQFAVGRACAREALRALAYPDTEVARGPSREPVWPAGVIGSISHTDDYCVAAAVRTTHLASVGIDAERKKPLSPGVVAKVCDEDELQQMAVLPEKLRTLFPVVLFSAKESLFKCLFQLGRLGPMGFRDVTLRIDWPRRQLSVQRLAAGVTAARCDALHGRFAISACHVLTYVAATATAMHQSPWERDSQ